MDEVPSGVNPGDFSKPSCIKLQASRYCKFFLLFESDCKIVCYLFADLVPDVQVNLTQATSVTESFNQMSFTLNKLPFGNTQSVGGVLLYSVVVSMVSTSNVGGGARARRNAADQLKFTSKATFKAVFAKYYHFC